MTPSAISSDMPSTAVGLRSSSAGTASRASVRALRWTS